MTDEKTFARPRPTVIRQDEQVPRQATATVSTTAPEHPRTFGEAIAMYGFNAAVRLLGKGKR